MSSVIPFINEVMCFVLTYVIGIIFGISVFALPLALAAFPQRQSIDVSKLEPEFQEKAEKRGVHVLVFNRGI